MDLPSIEQAAQLTLSLNLNDLGIPGVAIVLSPDEADDLGAFVEDAVDLDDVIASSIEGGAS